MIRLSNKPALTLYAAHLLWTNESGEKVLV